MKFKHTFHVFVDNFSVIYKHLVYGLIVLAVTVGLTCAIIYPATANIMDTAEYQTLANDWGELWSSVFALKTELLQEQLAQFRSSWGTFMEMLKTNKSGLFALCAALLLLVVFASKFLTGLGNYTMAAMINDRMSLRAKSPFMGTMIKNLGKASLYSVIYTPVSLVFLFASAALFWALYFKWLFFLPALVKIFMLAASLIFMCALKLTFVTDWLPALINAHTPNRKAILRSFRNKGADIASSLSNYLVLVLLIMVTNLIFGIFTFGAGLLITVPASYLLISCLQFVNYYNRNSLKYFLDDGNIIAPEKEHTPTVEEFFRGEE